MTIETLDLEPADIPHGTIVLEKQNDHTTN